MLALVVVALFLSGAVSIISFDGNLRSAAPVSPSSEALLAASMPMEMCLPPSLAESEKAVESSADPVGGELPPIRMVSDPYPTFNGISLDPANNRVAMSDENRKSVLVYDRTGGDKSAAVTSPLRQTTGPESQIGYIAGIMFDAAHHEIYAVNNDLDDRIVVFDDEAHGDIKPKRGLSVPHKAWGLSLNPAADQFAISVQQLSMVAIY